MPNSEKPGMMRNYLFTIESNNQQKDSNETINLRNFL